MNRLYVMTTKISGKKRRRATDQYVQGYCSSSSCDDISRPNTFSGHPLPDVTIKSEGEFTWQAVLDMLCEENETTPEHAPMQLAKALSFLEKKDLSSRMCFEEALLLHLLGYSGHY